MDHGAGLQVARGENGRLRAEIADLRSYIDGLPEALRNGPYAAPYRTRLDGLEDELATAELVAVESSCVLEAVVDDD